ncbi:MULTISPECIES: four helix bundle protein [unclassified Leeuwenhoekiella]|uniref:four helix bundle protein n=1 Tax=unclassified Leeuwenhoekiella TaxID=2615029 RepID=UPI000C523825|nr:MULTISPECIES: four helix bundle protein [unclassified Leeuwenhoekiella]MAW95879.1 four helix bundle protein [Leeuwenhoekiella sp.]MBA82850.1 four helix bundle protein [Leeuwenhoekiella sp.]|tara:strand:+ start:3358 stop:3747 length:390 start_codon:yes stop_codon:yes gene_type:complete
MAHYNSFEDLEVFKKARLLSQNVWEIIQTTELKQDFELRNQINASSGSIMDNIAEGFGRGGNKEFINFLGFAKGSCCETKSQLIRCLDRNYLDKDSFQKLNTEAQELIDQIGKFSNYLKKSEKRGSKFD